MWPLVLSICTVTNLAPLIILRMAGNTFVFNNVANFLPPVPSMPSNLPRGQVTAVRTMLRHGSLRIEPRLRPLLNRRYFEEPAAGGDVEPHFSSRSAWSYHSFSMFSLAHARRASLRASVKVAASSWRIGTTLSPF